MIAASNNPLNLAVVAPLPPLRPSAMGAGRVGGVQPIADHDPAPRAVAAALSGQANRPRAPHAVHRASLTRSAHTLTAAFTIVLLSSHAIASTTDPLTEGNALYRTGNYTAALETYGQPLPTSIESPALPQSENPRLRLARATAALAAAQSTGPTDAQPASQPSDTTSIEADLRALIADHASDPALLAAASANLGSLLLSKAESTARTDRPLAIDLFNQAASSYLTTARLDRTDLDAARNVEHARRRAAELKQDLTENPPTPQEQQSQQQRNQQNNDQSGQQNSGQTNQHNDHNQSESQSQDEQSPQEQAEQQAQEAQQQQQDAQELAESLSELAEQQQTEAQQSEAGTQGDTAQADQQSLSQQAQQQLEELERQTAEQEGQEQDEQQGDPQSDRQSQQADQQRDEGESQQPDQSDSPAQSMRQARQSLEQARQSQQEAQDALAQGDNATASEAQREASQQLAQASQHMQQAAQQLQQRADQAAQQAQQATQPDESQQSEQEQQQQAQAQQAEEQQAQQQAQGNPAQQASEREGDPLVERLLDRERRQRESRAVSRPGRPVRVERDW